MIQPFYNTTNLTGLELKEAVQRAKNQEEQIKLIYLNTRKAFTPGDIYEMLKRAGFNYPITSVRRAITNLQKKGELVMLQELKTGLFGAKEHYWKISVTRYPLITSEQQTLFA